MIRAVFQQNNGKLCGFSVCGHAGYADAGADIVCAAVSSAVQLAANLITENFGESAAVRAEDDTVACTLAQPAGNGVRVLEGLLAHLQCVSEEFPGTLQISVSEV